MTIQRYTVVTNYPSTRLEADGVTLTAIPTGTLVGEVLWDGVTPWAPEPGTMLVPTGTATLVAPPPPLEVPQVISMVQCRVTLAVTPSPRTPGITLLADVSATMPALGTVAVIAWEYATTVSRTSALVGYLIDYFGLTHSQVDTLFIQAAVVDV